MKITLGGKGGGSCSVNYYLELGFENKIDGVGAMAGDAVFLISRVTSTWILVTRARAGLLVTVCLLPSFW